VDVVGKVQSGIAVMTRKEIFAYLESRGWTQYYNENAWIHKKMITGKSDLCVYTLSTDCAYRKTKEWEKERA
jgi:hypothetical protein